MKKYGQLFSSTNTAAEDEKPLLADIELNDISESSVAIESFHAKTTEISIKSILKNCLACTSFCFCCWATLAVAVYLIYLGSKFMMNHTITCSPVNGTECPPVIQQFR